jgi:hypothetical protein
MRVHRGAPWPETEPSSDDNVPDITRRRDRHQPGRRAVDAGEAAVTGSLGTATTSVPVTVAACETVAVDVVLGSGELVLKGKRSEEATDFDAGIRWDVTSASGEVVTTYGGEVTLDLAAGDYTVKASLGEASVEGRVSVPAGKTIEQVVVVATGRLVANAYFAEGGPVVTAGPRFDVLDPEPGSDGNRVTIATSYEDGVTFDLPPGKYLRARRPAPPRRGRLRNKAGRRPRCSWCSTPAFWPSRRREEISSNCSAARRTSTASRSRWPTITVRAGRSPCPPASMC